MHANESRSKIDQTDTRRSWPSTLFRVLIVLDAVAILLQGLWAGIFLRHDGERDAAGSWIDTHALGGEVAIVLTIAATLVAVIWLRPRKDLWVGGAILAVLLILESYLGGLIRDDGKDDLTAVHIPLAMLLMTAIAVLTVRAMQRFDSTDRLG